MIFVVVYSILITTALPQKVYAGPISAATAYALQQALLSGAGTAVTVGAGVTINNVQQQQRTYDAIVNQWNETQAINFLQQWEDPEFRTQTIQKQALDIEMARIWTTTNPGALTLSVDTTTAMGIFSNADWAISNYLRENPIIEVPVVPARISTENYMSLIASQVPAWEAMRQKEQEMKDAGYIFCFINQEFLPLEVPIKDNYLLGICELTGLAVYDINDFETFLFWEIATKGSELEISIHQNVKTSFVDNRGQECTFIQNGSILTYRIDGRDMIGISVNGEMKGFIRTLCGRTWKVVKSVTINDGSTYLLPMETEINGNIISQTPTAPAVPSLSLAEINALNDMQALMAQLLARVEEIQGQSEHMYFMAPVATAEDFPGIPAEDFNLFMTAILSQLDGIDSLLMTQAQIDSIPAEIVINLDKLLEGTANPPDVGTETGVIAGILQGISQGIRTLQNLLQAILQAIQALSAQIATAVSTNVDDTYVPPGMDVNLHINLMDYFPFCIPQDFVDIVSILLGTMPPQLAGATAHEKAVFFHYQELEYISPEGQAFLALLFANSFSNQYTADISEGYDVIEPMFISNLTTTPRFEFHIPFPNFTNAVGTSFEAAFINMTQIHVATIDFDDYPTLVAVIRLGVFSIFLIAMINATTKMMTW